MNWLHESLSLLGDAERTVQSDIAIVQKRKPSAARQRELHFLNLALGQIDHARKALAICPEGAKAVYHAMQLSGLADYHAKQGSKLQYLWRTRAAAETNHVRSQKSNRVRAQIRQLAAKAKPTLSDHAKATSIRKRWNGEPVPSIRTICRYLPSK